jgi:16S rRNA (adenine1518-N6/adenine1519-N6)-dimethyltransferase
VPGAKETLHKLGLTAKKRLGQNFLTNEDDLRFIAESSSAVPGERVIEIGPGLGALTAFLLEKGFAVSAVEKDYSLVTHLNSQFKGLPLEVFCLDVLKFDIHQALKIEKPLTVFGNIPYNITSPIVFWLVEQRAFVKSAVLMTQKEVAERLAGTPGHEGWGAVSVSLQAYANVRMLRTVPKGHFFPAPKVDSAVIRLDFLPHPRFEPPDRETFHRIVAKAFQKRRKTLLNALEDEAGGLARETLSQTFLSIDLDPKRRPETLSVADWVLLARALREVIK